MRHVLETSKVSLEKINDSSEIPPITKEFFTKNFKDRESAKNAISCELEEIVNCYETSKGSLVLVSMQDELAFLDTWESFIDYYDGRGKMLVNAAPLGPWGSGRETDKTRSNWILTAPQFYSEDEYLSRFKKWKPELMLLFPGLIAKLANYMTKVGFDPKLELSTLETIFIAGEMSSRGFREKMSDFFDARVVDLYAATEFGTIAVEKKDRSGLITYADRFVIQRKDDSPNSPILITDLRKTALPMIRYSLGDIVRQVSIDESGFLFLDFISGRTNEVISVGAADFSRRDFEEIIGKYPYLSRRYKIIVNEGEDHRKNVSIHLGMPNNMLTANNSKLIDSITKELSMSSSTMNEAILRGFIHPPKIYLMSEAKLKESYPEIFAPKAANLIEYKMD